MAFRRRPAVAGVFYEAGREELLERVKWCFLHELGPGSLPEAGGGPLEGVRAYVVPHAGLMYSGPVAAHSYRSIAEGGCPDTFIIVGPNHYGYGNPVSTMDRGFWDSPLGGLEVDSELAGLIIGASRYLVSDPEAHEWEHSIEVQLPFIAYICGGRSRIVPIALYLQSGEVARDLSEAILEALGRAGRSVVLLASTDWTHYEPHEEALRKDLKAISYVERVDPEGLEGFIGASRLSMCGPGGVLVALHVARRLGVRGARLLKYATSGDVTGERASVVGYASIKIA